MTEQERSRRKLSAFSDKIAAKREKFVLLKNERDTFERDQVNSFRRKTAVYHANVDRLARMDSRLQSMAETICNMEDALRVMRG